MKNNLLHTFNLYNHVLVLLINQFYHYILWSIDIDIREIWRLIRRVLTEHHADLPGLLKPSLADLAKEMFIVGLISDDVLKNPTYSNIIGDFLTGINSMKNCTKLQKYVKMFLMILNNLGGDCTHVSNVLQIELTEIIKRELNIESNFMLELT